ncbi:MAG: SMC-Scp complex subunit ScpB [Minisyncoccia bacterium]|jgi:segregation and condensation protein B
MEMEEKNNNTVSALEALFFYYGEPLDVKKISKLLGIKESDCDALIEELSLKLRSDEKSGLTLVKHGNFFQLATRPELAWLGQKLIQEEFKEELTPAALETLSIIAYLGPVPRSTVDYVRGVNSSFILRSLLVRGLVNREVQATRKNTFEYRVSFDFLKHLGLEKIEDLPEYEKYKNILTSFEATQSSENPEAGASTEMPETQ